MDRYNEASRDTVRLRYSGRFVRGSAISIGQTVRSVETVNPVLAYERTVLPVCHERSTEFSLERPIYPHTLRLVLCMWRRPSPR